MKKLIDKLIDDIIELVMGDMDCHHEWDRDEDGTHTSVEYNLNNEAKLRQMIGELLCQNLILRQEELPSKQRDNYNGVREER